MEMNNRSSLKINMILNAIKGIMGILFPLISFPYASKVLGVVNLGKYNFSSSLINYFILFAGLGISTYAIREGAKIRENPLILKKFSAEMFSINILSTLVSYALLIIFYCISSKLHDYRNLLFILSMQILFKTIGVEWIYSIFEDYLYITIRSILFQFVSLACLLIFVRTDSDVNKYAIITVFSVAGANILNYMHAKRYCKFRVTKKLNLKRHIRPILILFAMSVTVTIYVSSDITILGYLCSDETVGIYSVSTKVYSIIKTILSSILVVSIPRLAAMLGNNTRTNFDRTASDIYRTLITIVLPAITGIILMSEDIVLLLSNKTYIDATSSLRLLGVSLFFCLGAWFWGQCILVPLKMETAVFRVTVVSAIVNIVLNLMLIPFWREEAAAFTTILAEGISFFWCSLQGRKHTKLSGIGQTYRKVGVGCVAIAAIAYFIKITISSLYLRVISTVSVTAIIYFGIEITLKNEAISDIFIAAKRKFKNN